MAKYVRMKGVKTGRSGHKRTRARNKISMARKQEIARHKRIASRKLKTPQTPDITEYE